MICGLYLLSPYSLPFLGPHSRRLAFLKVSYT